MWRWTSGTRRRSTSAPRRAASGRPRTTARPGRRSSIARAWPRSATSPLTPSQPDLVWVGTGEPNNRQSSTLRRRHLQVHRRRTHVDAHGAARDAAHRPRHHRPGRSRHRLRGRARASLGAQRRARRVQDDRRRPDLDQREVRRRGHRLRRHGDGSRATARCSTPRPISGAARRGASTAAAPAAALYKTADGGRTWTKLHQRASRRRHRPHRPRHLAQGSARGLRHRRAPDRAAAPSGRTTAARPGAR